jgi:hypothetical protein
MDWVNLKWLVNISKRLLMNYTTFVMKLWNYRNINVFNVNHESIDPEFHWIAFWQGVDKFFMLKWRQIPIFFWEWQSSLTEQLSHQPFSKFYFNEPWSWAKCTKTRCARHWGIIVVWLLVRVEYCDLVGKRDLRSWVLVRWYFRV